jgi:hypothetical protein
MALGGGIFTSQNKVIPGTYINFVSVAKASATLSERGIVALPLELKWGKDNEVISLESSNFEREALYTFGYSYSAEEMKGLRDVFKNARIIHVYRINSGVKASGEHGEAKCSGSRGNDLAVLVSANVEDETKYDVTTMLGNTEIETQTVNASSQLVDNDFISFNKTVTLTVSANPYKFSGGTEGEVTGERYQAFLDKIESYDFHTLGCLSTTAVIKSLMIAFTKRMRDEQGSKIQTVIYNADAPDYEGIINVKNAVTDAGANGSELVYWISGAAAACAVSKSNTNKNYDGEYKVNVSFTQLQLEQTIATGYFTLHKVGNEIHVLEDINSLTTVTAEKGDSMKSNQVIRVLDQTGNDIATLFNKTYLGKVQNNEAGRIGLWSDIVTYNKELETLGAIENFTSEDVKVTLGADKKSVTIENAIQPVYAMEKLYMTVLVQ